MLEAGQGLGRLARHRAASRPRLGVGMCLAVRPEDVDKTIEAINGAGEEAFVLGKAVAGEKGVTIC